MMLPLVRFLFVPWALAQTQPSDQNNPLPAFQDYKVAHIYKGKPATPVLKTPADREYRTRIRRGAAEGANFSGHYAVVILGCGTQCSSFLIVDVQDGRVFARAQKESTCQPYYNLDSRLLVTDVCTGPPTGTGCNRAFWEWTGTELRFLARTPISCDAPDLPKGFRLPNAATKPTTKGLMVLPMGPPLLEHGHAVGSHDGWIHDYFGLHEQPEDLRAVPGENVDKIRRVSGKPVSRPACRTCPGWMRRRTNLGISTEPTRKLGFGLAIVARL
jgi:hypothetical protein